MSDIVSKIIELVTPIVANAGCEMVDVEYVKEGSEQVLRLFVENLEIETQGGVGHQTCVQISSRVLDVLEERGIPTIPYRLEVSSPGLTRALKKKNDFERFAGRLALIRTFRPVELKKDFASLASEPVKQKRFLGVLEGIEGENVLIRVGKELWSIPLGDIRNANLEFDPSQMSHPISKPLSKQSD
ncbi:MAG: ribosome maturation factor RimP [Magnetococcus sp. DMHC-6]